MVCTRSVYIQACTGSSREQNWLRAQRVCKLVLAYMKKHAPKFSILQALA